MTANDAAPRLPTEPRTTALSELRLMHGRAHDLPWDECEVCGIIRAGIVAEAAAPDLLADVIEATAAFDAHHERYAIEGYSGEAEARAGIDVEPRCDYDCDACRAVPE